jgi:hypothetical protein
MIKKPVVLISSTIYDFRDLRSSLKYWFEQLGYDVLLSEFNDFAKGFDDNSYEACLKAIDRADYFILLIGARVGGWYDEQASVSITRMEYRHALEGFRKNGLPRLATFVRQGLWDVREDRTSLGRYLEHDDAATRELSADLKSRIGSHPSRFVNNANATFDFLREVGQSDDMKKAAAGLGQLPRGNWIHQFNTFDDIASALRVGMGLVGNVEQRILFENLRQELLRNLCHLLYKFKDEAVMPLWKWGIEATKAIKGDIDDSTTMPSSYVRRLVIFKIAAGSAGANLTSIFALQAIRSGIFMMFDANSSRFKSTIAHELLMELYSLIHVENRRGLNPTESAEFLNKMKPYQSGNRNVTVVNMDLVFPCQHVLNLQRITDISLRFIKFLDGNDSALAALENWSGHVIPEQAPKIDQERVGLDLAERWVKSS